MKVILRACDSKDSVNGLPRPWGLSKREVIETCFRTLHLSLKGHPYELHIIGDGLSDKIKEFFKSLEPNSTLHEYNGLGNDGSIMKSFELAESFEDEDLIYFCEDDYIHVFDSFYDKISFFMDTYKDHETPFFVHPSDYPDQYSRLMKKSFVLLSRDCHFREVCSSTFTFLVHKKNFMKFADVFKKSSDGAQDGEFSKIFGDKALCFSPIPGLASHMHQGTMGPYTLWDMVQHYANDLCGVNQQITTLEINR
jgi:hypothetical protein